MKGEPKSEQAAVTASDSEVYEASHFVPKLFMQSVNAAVEADSSPHVFNDDRNPALCSLQSSANPLPKTHTTLTNLQHMFLCVCACVCGDMLSHSDYIYLVKCGFERLEHNFFCLCCALCESSLMHKRNT